MSAIRQRLSGQIPDTVSHPRVLRAAEGASSLLDGPTNAAEELERADLSAWSELSELEIDTSPGFRPTVLERKLPKCGFCINEKDDPRAYI